MSDIFRLKSVVEEWVRVTCWFLLRSQPSVVILSGGVRMSDLGLNTSTPFDQEIMSGWGVRFRKLSPMLCEDPWSSPGQYSLCDIMWQCDMRTCWHVKRLQYNTNTKSYPWLQFPLTVQFFCSWSLELNVCRVRRENINKQTEQTTQTDQYLCLVTTPTTIRVLIKQLQAPPIYLYL